MSDHIQECPVYEGPCCPWMGDCDCQCLCDILSACELRMKQENALTCLMSQTQDLEQRELAYNAGYDYGLKAAREAVAALPIMKIAGNFPLCDTDDALAAIDSLRGNDESSQTM